MKIKNRGSKSKFILRENEVSEKVIEKKEKEQASTTKKNAKIHHGSHPPKAHQKTRKKMGKNKNK